MKLIRALVAVYTMIPAYPASGPELRIQSGHSDDIRTVEFSPDGARVITASVDGTARLWEVATGFEIREFGGACCGPVSSATFSPDGRQVLTTAAGDVATIYDVATGGVVRQFKAHLPGSGVFSPDGRRVLVGELGNLAHLWDVPTGRELQQLPGNSRHDLPVAFSPDGKTILTGGEDGLVRLYDAASGREIRRFNGHSETVTSVAFSPDGRSILTASYDFTVRLWDVATGAEKKRLVHGLVDDKGNVECVEKARFAPDGRSVLTGGGCRFRPLLIETATGRVIRRLDTINSESVAFSPDGRLAVTGGGEPENSDRNIAQIWDLATGRELRRLEGHSIAVSAVQFSADGHSLLLGGSTISRWDLAEGRETKRFNTGSLHPPDFSQDGRLAVTANYDPPKGLMWDTATGRVAREFIFRAGSSTTAMTGVRFSPSSRWVLTFDTDNTTRYWNAKTGGEVAKFENDVPEAVAFSPNGRTIVIAGGNSVQVVMRSIADGVEVRRFADEFDKIRALAFSPDGRYLAGAGVGAWVETKYSAPVRMFDWQANLRIRTFGEDSDSVSAIAFSPDGRVLLTGSEDETARLFDVESGREIRKFVGHSGPVRAVGFSPDGRFVVTGSEDCTTRVWETATGYLLATMILFRKGGWAVVAPDGRYDASDKKNLPGVYWADGNKVTGLAQRGEKYFTPGLLAKLPGVREAPK